MALGFTFWGKEHGHYLPRYSALGRLDSALCCSELRLPKKLAMPESK